MTSFSDETPTRAARGWLGLTCTLAAGLAVSIAALAPHRDAASLAQPSLRTVSAIIEPGDAPASESKPLVEVIITLHGGGRAQGMLVEKTDERYVVRMSGVDQLIDVTSVARITYLPPVIDRYHEMKAGLEDDDVSGRIMLAMWLRDRSYYGTALTEVNEALKIDQYNERATRLKTWLEAQIELLRKQTTRPDPSAAEAGDETDADEDSPEFPRLSDDQINLLRVYELNLSNPPRMHITPEVIEEFMQAYAGSDLIPSSRAGREAFRRMSADRILEVMFRLRAREFYNRVLVLENPETLDTFKREVHGSWLSNSCAGVRCHGGQEAGRLWLYPRQRNSDRTALTNFYIIENFHLDDGTPLINYEEPARSPLLQMALPPDQSLYPHPEVASRRGSRGYRPVFRSDRDAKFRQSVAWIRSMYQPRPETPIDYEPPVPGPLRDRATTGPDR